MPKKLDENGESLRVQLIASRPWLNRVEEWRAAQRPVPNTSSAIRYLVELGLRAEDERKAKRATGLVRQP